MTVCVDDFTFSNSTNDPAVLSHLSIGSNTPDTSAIQEYQLKNLGLSVFAGPLTHAEIEIHHPVSVSLIDPIFHPCLIKKAEINLLDNAIGARGSHPTRSIANSQGSVSFFGKRGKGSRSGLSSTEGPRMSDQSHYYRQHTDAQYLPGLM